MSRIDSNYFDDFPKPFTCCISFTVNTNRLHEEVYADVLRRELQLIEAECHLKWITWVILPNQFHGLFETEHKNLSFLLTSLKNRIDWQLNLSIRIRKLFWLDGLSESSPTINTDKFIDRILQEPVRAGLVSCFENWPNRYTELLPKS